MLQGFRLYRKERSTLVCVVSAMGKRASGATPASDMPPPPVPVKKAGGKAKAKAAAAKAISGKQEIKGKQENNTGKQETKGKKENNTGKPGKVTGKRANNSGEQEYSEAGKEALEQVNTESAALMGKWTQLARVGKEKQSPNKHHAF